MYQYYHNHYKKDYSHFWCIIEEKQIVLKKTLRRIGYAGRYISMLFLWPIYLYLGIPDGGHLLLYGRLWENTEITEKIRGYMSSILSCCSFCVLLFTFKYKIITYYIIPWLFYGWWLFTVTFLQHHHTNIHLYDKKWTWVGGAFETIDRDYGSLINRLSHNITDCHVIHHLFFLKIPHYNLTKATQQLKEGLRNDNLLHLYKCEKTYHFYYYIFEYYFKHWHFISQKQLD